MPTQPDFPSQTIAVFPRRRGRLRLISTESGTEILPGTSIPEPYGRGTVVYLGSTVEVTWVRRRWVRRPGSVAVVRYSTPETDWTYLPAELGARYSPR